MSAPSIEELLEAVRQVQARDFWSTGLSMDRPRLFELLTLAADLPRFADQRALAALPADFWPQLSQIVGDLSHLQELVDRPAVPGGAATARIHDLEGLSAASQELEANHCVGVDFLFETQQQEELDRCVADLAKERMGSWGQLERPDAPDLFDLFDNALGSARFGQLTGFDLDRDTYTLTLSLQDLDGKGIGWHRDLYWPREWVGEDVFAVLYGLGDDSPEKGGAFLYYVPWSDDLYLSYRQRHQATILWNSKENDRRLLHAVSEYLTEDTSRHLIILQCLRRS